MQFERVKEDQILASFPYQMLTSKVHEQVLKCLELLAESHQDAADAMYTAKKLMLIILVGAFQLIMQGILQPVINPQVNMCDTLTHWPIVVIWTEVQLQQYDLR